MENSEKYYDLLELEKPPRKITKTASDSNEPEKRRVGNPNGWNTLARKNSIKTRRRVAIENSKEAVDFIRWLKKEYPNISVREITRRLNMSGYKTTRGKTFLPGSTQNLFKYL